DGRLRDLPGGVDEYLRLREQARARAGATAAARTATAGARTATGPATGADGIPARSSGSSPAAPSASAATPADVRDARKVMARVEKQLSRLADREAKLHGEMASAATDPVALTDLNGKLQALVAEREELELEWLEAAEVVG